jgi:hypothetical protein
MFFNSESFYIVISAIFISLSGFFAFAKFPKEAFILILSGVFSALFHLIPTNQFLRFLDWFFAFILILLLLPKIYFLQNINLNIFAFLLFLLWVTSFLSFHFGKIQIYNFTHTIWHFGVAIFVVYLLK